MIEEINNYFPNFTESKFKTYIDNVFVQIHISIMTKELEKIKHFVTEDLYEKLTEKVNILNEKHLIEMFDELNVKQTTLLSQELQGDEIFLKVNITSRYMDYFMDEDGNYVSGNNTSRIEKENYLIVKKNINALDPKMARRCAGCGYPMDVNASGKCTYCGRTYDLENEGWILCSLEVM